MHGLDCCHSQPCFLLHRMGAIAPDLQQCCCHLLLKLRRWHLISALMPMWTLLLHAATPRQLGARYTSSKGRSTLRGPHMHLKASRKGPHGCKDANRALWRADQASHAEAANAQANFCAPDSSSVGGSRRGRSTRLSALLLLELPVLVVSHCVGQKGFAAHKHIAVRQVERNDHNVEEAHLLPGWRR